MELTPCEKFLLSDSFDSDDSDVETMLATFRQQTLVMALAVKEHEDEHRKRRQGSTVGRLCIPQNRHLGNEMLMQDYFAENPTYPPHLFWRRYRMRRSLFVKIVEACEANCRYFTQRRNVAVLKEFSAYQKISAAMRVIAYGVPADYTNEFLRIGEDSTIESVRRFAKVIVRVFAPDYLWAPNEDDTKKLMVANERRAWPGMLDSIDCTHRNWKNCPKAWQGMYCGKSRDATIVLEVVASEDLWIWHCFFICPAHSMISMCCNALICLLGLLVVMLLLATTLSMGMNTPKVTILQMVYTLLGAHLSRASKTPKLGNNVNSQGYKRQPEKTLKEHSGFCNLG